MGKKLNKEQKIEELELASLPKGYKQLLGFSYWSFGIGFGPLIPLVAAWVFRKKQAFCQQLLQSAVIQGFSFLFSSCLFISLISVIRSEHQVADSLENLRTTAWGTAFFALKSFYDWTNKIMFFFASLYCFKKGHFNIPLLNFLTKQLLKWLEKISIKKAVFLSFIWPGFGHLHLGKNWFGWILAFSQLVTVLSLLSLSLAYYDFVSFKTVVSALGFYLRLGDESFKQGFVQPSVIATLFFVFVLHYFVALVNLPVHRPGHKLISKAQRTYFASLNVSYFLHICLLWSILLLPFILNPQTSKSSIEKQSEAIYKKLKEIKEEQKDKEKNKKNKPQIKPLEETSENSKSKELKFDLEITKNIEGINEFSTKPFQKNKANKTKQTSVGFSDRKEPLPKKENYLKEFSRKSKSYSEYLTAKVRENGRDKVIWAKAPKDYSIVLQYTIETDGHISSIQIIEGSDNLKVDSLTVAVVKSMSPLIKPKPDSNSNQKSEAKKRLKITELFWNTHGIEKLDTELKKSLATYPDGRVIEEI